MITATATQTLVKRRLGLTISLTDSVVLTNKAYTGTLNWGDGSLATVLSGTLPAQLNLEHLYQSDGLYLVQLAVANKKAPTADTATLTLPVEIAVNPVVTPSRGYLFGPILPRDVGQPSRDTWCFSLGQDSLVLESNLRLLILTSFGERLMMPSFGTGIRKLLFEPNQHLVETVIREELVAAVAKYEPRATIDSLSVNRVGDHELVINVTFVSKDAVGQVISMPMSITA